MNVHLVPLNLPQCSVQAQTRQRKEVLTIRIAAIFCITESIKNTIINLDDSE